MRGGEFLVTKEYRRFAEFCAACRRDQYIGVCVGPPGGVCVGPPGVGKTLSARHYTRWDLLEPFITRYLTEDELPSEIADCHALLYTPAVATTPGRIESDVRVRRRTLGYLVEDATKAQERQRPRADAPDCLELLIVDEADRLKMSGLEQIRDIYDCSALGVVLIGMPGLDKRLSRFPQLYSRVGFVHQFRALSPEELRFILSYKWAHLGLMLQPEDFTDAEAIAAITRITGGNFRLLQRLFAQIERILRINELQMVTKEVVEAAREVLVIGPV